MKNKLFSLMVRFIGYIIALGLSLLFALFLSSATGWTFFYMLSAALVFSLIVQLMTYISCKKGKITVELSFAQTLVYKREPLILHIKVVNKSFLPLSNIHIAFPKADGIEYSSDEVFAAVSAGQTSSFDVTVTPHIWGVLDIGKVNVGISDFMQLTEFFVNVGKRSEKVYVFPDIPEISADCPFVRAAADDIRFSDDCEDTRENDGVNFFGGNAGFTHREYVEGDPIKRINWKLSSKKDVYYVRLDDEVEAMRQIIVIDRSGNDRRLCERAVEGTLGVVFALLKLGCEVEIWFYTENGFAPFNVSDEGGLSELRTALAYYEFSEKNAKPRLPLDKLCEKERKGNIMLFSPLPDKLLAAELSEAEEYGLKFTVVSHNAFPEFDVVDDDFIEKG